MITLLANTFPIALSLAAPSLPEVPSVVLLITLAMALVLAMAAVLALAWAPTHLAHSLIHTLVATVDSASAREQQNLIKPSAANPVIETTAYRLAMPFTHRHAASPSLTLDLNQSRPTRQWVGRSSRKGSWFTLIAPVLPLNTQNLTLVGSVNSNLLFKENKD
jgi:hypothetical protein